ncbi:endonuclease/exonuclease/phosphatase family protein [Nocardioides sp.]|uniref:endonuclease/exonuclease/phosphatase family protein n=1 Tax=Nocardioides sp. TaxID=35761 RepID=UPI002ED2B980
MRPLRLLTACLVGVLVACSPATTDAPAPPTPPPAGSAPFSLLQMNLCLSGLAPCVEYPEVVREAITVIREHRPDAVTLNEVCSRDVARIAQRTGYHRRFSTVPYSGGPLPCRAPSGRGVFGNALLTAAQIVATVDHRFSAQSIDPEQRRWLCVTTAQSVTVCTTHLSSPSELRTAVLRQCAELTDVLAVRARRGPTIAAGDMNNLGSCAPAGMWTRTDVEGVQTPGVQHAYGSASHLHAATAEVLPATYTDHDFLYVRARLMS